MFGKSKDCEQCPKLEERVKELEKEIKELKKERKAVICKCNSLAAHGNAKLSMGNLPRGEWAYSRSMVETVNEILPILGQAKIILVIDKAKSMNLFSGMFSGFFS